MSFGGGFLAAFEGLKKIEIRKANTKLRKEQKKREKQDALLKELESKLSEDEYKILLRSKDLSRIEENQKSDLQCPECHSEFFILKVGQVEICGCNRCRSIWLDYDQALQFENSKEIIPTHKRCRKSKYLCPKCEDEMIECVYKIPGNLLVDICSQKCGVYFEQGEVARAIYLNNKIYKG